MVFTVPRTVSHGGFHCECDRGGCDGEWGEVVDAVGIEPTTSRLRVECSTS